MEIKRSDSPVDYPDAVSAMETRVAKIRAGTAADQLWLLEHPSLYTGGTSADVRDLRNPKFPVYPTGRGGQYTYHGPGQRIGYVMIDLKNRQQSADIKRYVCDLEEWMIRTVAHFGVKGERREGRIGIWVETPSGEKKIAALGVRVRHWVTYHGVALNNDPDLSHFDGIVPCGIANFGVTSLKDLGISVSKQGLDDVLSAEFTHLFGTQSAASGRDCDCA